MNTPNTYSSPSIPLLNIEWSNACQLLPLPEGYYRDGKYYAVIHDYLGSVRVVLRANDNKIQEVNHYDPFGIEYGLSYHPFGVQPFKHQGKERMNITGFSLHNHGARLADNVMGRWTTRDPLEEDYYWNGAYVYCNNNPVKFVDEDGKEPISGNDRPFGRSDFAQPHKGNQSSITRSSSVVPIVKGALTTAGGVVAVVGGVAACVSGFGVLAGGAAISFGIPAIGLGIGQIVDGATTGGEKNIPGGVFEALGQATDKVTGEQFDFSRGGAFLDILSTGKPTNATESAVTAGQLLLLGTEETNTQSNTNQHSTSESTNSISTTTSSSPATQNDINQNVNKKPKNEIK